MNAILFWELIPENSAIYVIPNITPEEEKVLRLAHNKILNSANLSDEESTALNCINNALCTQESYCFFNNNTDIEENKSWCTKWSEYKIDGPIVITTNSLIIKCGFLL